LALSTGKPAGPDNLPPKFLKAVFQSLVKPLTILFQKSLNFGVVSGDWKLANVSIFFSSTKIRIFFSATLGIRIFF
jgi:hypothetical protein